MDSGGPSATPPFGGEEEIDLYGEHTTLGPSPHRLALPNQTLAELLGIDKSASANDVKKAYRKVCLQIELLSTETAC